MAHRPKQVTTPDSNSPLPERVVGIGSSAGGLEALTEFLHQLPADLPFTYVVAQHLDPVHESALVELLARETSLEVELATPGMRLRPGVVVVAPPNHDILVSAHTVEVVEAAGQLGPLPRIDVLLRSLADSWHDRAVGIVLSGTGSDGAQGLNSIHLAGGLTLAQEPTTAAFTAMPEAAAAAGAADLVLPPAEMGAALARAAATTDEAESSTRAGSPLPGPSARRPGPPLIDESELLRAIAIAVRSQTGLDFTEYKESTLRRQVGRRLAISGVPSLDNYLAFIAKDPSEAHVLARSMQIGVTSFFRDPEEWQGLRGPLTDYLETLAPTDEVRVWTAGCSTGEEAYSVAMLVADILGNPAVLSGRLKVFATDVSESSLDVARKGFYSDDAVAPIPPDMRDRWLRKGDRGWDVSPELREVLVFARHNVAVDPGFPRLNLVTCRNTLIYFRPELQDRVIHLCHLSLASNGLLMLGASERITGSLDLFDALDPKHRIFRRRPGSRRLVAPTPWPSRAAEPFSTATSALLGRRAALRDALIRRFAPPSLVIDADQHVVEVVGDVTPWCWVAEGQPTSHVLGLLREGLRPVVRSMLVEARTGATVERDVNTPNGRVRVSVHSLGSDASGLATVSFEGLDSHPPTEPTSGDGSSSIEEAIGSELQSTRLALQATIEELGASNEELQALNEELQASTEELQASGEEVQASYEELEVTNEELISLNAEMQGRTDALAHVNADLENIQSSLTSGLILVDQDLQITRFTPLSVRLFPLITADIGRRLTAIPPVIPVRGLEESLRSTIETRTSEIIEVSGATGDFLLSFQPYIGSSGEIHGAVLVITDITELAQARRESRHVLRVLTRSTDSLQEVMWHRDASGRLTFINAAIESVYGLSRDRALADPNLLLAAVHPDDRDRYATFSASSSTSRSLLYRILRADGALRWVSETAVTVPAEGEAPTFAVGTALDVTDRVVAQSEATRRGLRLEAMIDNEIVGFLALDRAGLITEANATIVQMTGYDVRVLVGKQILSLLIPDESSSDSDPARDPYTSDFPAGVAQRILIAKDGSRHHVTIDTRVLPPSTDDGAARVVVVYQLDRLRALSSESAANDPFDRETGLMTRVRFRSRVNDEFARLARTGTPFAVLWVDLDGFKQVNDAYGHQVGDLVLAETARRLLATARRQDSVGRLGGDEFAILITDMDEFDDLDAVTERYLSSIREPIAVADALVYVSGSIGVAIAPADGTDPNSLLHSADTAMYAAKAAGRDRRTYFQPTMNEAAELRAASRQNLTTAIRNRDFVMDYQPIVDLHTGAVRAVEALLRWHDGDALIPACDFIDIASETGQIRALGRIALDLINADMLGTDGVSPLDNFTIAINLSADELSERDTFEWLAAWNPPRGGYARIAVEVTETSIFRRGSRALETVSLLRRLGASLSIDDFGVGYSNLALLGELNPDIIKIDRSLLEGAGRDARGADLLDATVRMARAFGSSVVLEGVETLEQEALAHSIAVDWTQGYLRARPMPLALLENWLREHPDVQPG